MINRGLLVVLALSLCTALQAMEASHVEVEGAYALLPAPGQKNTALYMKIENHSNKTFTRVSAVSPIAKKIELHEMTLANGVMKMRKVINIRFKPHSTLTLEQGGYHFMVTGIKKPLVENQKIPVTLCLDDLCQKLEVKVVHPLSVEKETQKHHHSHH